MPRHRRFFLSSGLAALNAAILMIPRWAANRPGDPRAFAAFLVLATIFCFTEATLVDEVPHGERNLAALATLTGVTILGTFVTAIATEGSPMHDGIAVACGVAVMASGVLLRSVAVYTLGPRFVSELHVSPGEPLLRQGVYRWLRHPSEVGLLALTAGAAILFRSLSAVAVWTFVLVPLTAARIRVENAFLLGAHPGAK